MSKIKNDCHELSSMKDLEKTPKYNACKRMIEEAGLNVFLKNFRGLTMKSLSNLQKDLMEK